MIDVAQARTDYLAEVARSAAAAAATIGDHLTARSAVTGATVTDRAAGLRWMFAAIDFPAERARSVWDARLTVTLEVLHTGDVRVLHEIASGWLNRETPDVPSGLDEWLEAPYALRAYRRGLERITRSANA